MKRFVILALLLISIAFLGCIEERATGPSDSGPEITAEPLLEEAGFNSEAAAFDALTQELEGMEDMELADLEKALQE